MKRILGLLVVTMMLVSCKNDQQKETEAPIKKVTIEQKDVKAIVDYLAQDKLEGRAVGSQGIDYAATFIEETFKSYDVKPYYRHYRDEFRVDTLEAYNVIGFIPGNDETLKEEIVIVGAHYDHVGFRAKPVENDSIANGANDNASGTAAVLEMAHYFAQTKSNKRSIMFALFSAEEVGLKGSEHLARRLRSEKANVYTVLNFEMLGVPFKDKPYEVFVTGYDKSNLGAKMNAYTNSKMVGASEVAIKYSLFKRSDNYPFYQTMEIPSHTISSCDLTNFDYYHHVDDEVIQINYKFMTDIINKMIPAVEQITRTPTKEIVLNYE